MHLYRRQAQQAADAYVYCAHRPTRKASAQSKRPRIAPGPLRRKEEAQALRRRLAMKLTKPRPASSIA